MKIFYVRLLPFLVEAWNGSRHPTPATAMYGAGGTYNDR